MTRGSTFADRRRLSGRGLIAACCFLFARPIDAKGQEINFDDLEDVADIAQISYQGTLFNPFNGVMRTYGFVTNMSDSQAIDAPVLLVIDSISDPNVVVLNADGTTPDGKKYFDFSTLLGGDSTLSPGETSQPRQMLFRNLARRPFSFQGSCIAVIPLGAIPPAPTLDPHERMTNSSSVAITGAAPGGASVEVSGPEGVFEVAVTGGAFSANVPLGANRVNHLFLTTIAPSGTRSAPAATAITQDAQPPNLFIDFPADGAEVTTATADVGGRVGDILSGFMGLTVTVNGISAIVDVGIGNNGTFFAASVPLAVGANVIEATASDELGNSVTKHTAITRVEIPPDAPRMAVVSGNRQTGQIGTLLADAIVVQVTRGDGTPFANKLVTLQVLRSNGRLAEDGTSEGAMTLQVRADAAGQARVFWRVGFDAGCGNNRVGVTSRDIAGTVLFCASATPGPATQINVGAGNNQRAEVGSPAPEPLRVWVSDACNGVANIPVTFTVRRGGGTVNGLDEVTVSTGDTGHAEVDLILGPDAGNNDVEANFPGNPLMGAFFIVNGVLRDEDLPTRFSGLVLDNGNRAIEGAACTLVAGGQAIATITDSNGLFNFDDVPGAGRSDLFIDGLTATAVGGQAIPQGSFPFLHYEPVLIPNAANTLPTPIRLPPLNPSNAVAFDNTQDVVLTVEGMEGLSMLVRASSMTRADGTVPAPGSPAIIALNQVHVDDVPMPIPDGAAPPFAWTLQPGGATFDPPVQITYPNMSGLPAGSITYFLSFNHDTMRFEIVATGQVSDDGSTIVSDPGSGISTAGWGCNCPPYSVTGDCCECDECDSCNCGQCVEECTEECTICDGTQCRDITITLIKPTQGQEFSIGMNGPTMPTDLTVEIADVGIPELEYRFVIEIPNTQRALLYEDAPSSGYQHPPPIESEWTTQRSWTVAFGLQDTVYGGHATHVKVMVRKDGQTVCERVVERDFFIIGDSLSTTLRNGYIDSLSQYSAEIRKMAKAIALKETVGTHYWDPNGPIGTASHKRYPMRESGGGGGYGVMQLTSPGFLNRDTIWNWKRNIDKAMEVIKAGYDLGAAHLNTHPGGVTPRMKRLEGYNRYNGASTDRYHWWNDGMCQVPQGCGLLTTTGWTRFGYATDTCGGIKVRRDYNNDSARDCDGNPFCISAFAGGSNNCHFSATKYADVAIGLEQ